MVLFLPSMGLWLSEVSPSVQIGTLPREESLGTKVNLAFPSRN